MDGGVDIWKYERMDDWWIHTYDLCIMCIKLSHTRVLIHTTHRWAQSDWQLLLRTILTCMFGSNYTPGTLWHCEVTSWSSLIWWGEQSMLPSSLWCKEYFCIDYVGVCYESVYAVAHITASPPSSTTINPCLCCICGLRVRCCFIAPLPCYVRIN